VCGLVFERNPGDTWMFTVILDRLPVAAIVVLLYFSIFRAHRALGVATFAAVAAMFVWTSPNRWGVGIALHYLSRVRWPDPSDPVPGPVPCRDPVPEKPGIPPSSSGMSGPDHA
jgi:hypothetical protein